MANKTVYKTTFEVGQVIRPIFTGGPVVLSQDASLLATSLSEDVVLTDLSTGDELDKIEGDGDLVTAIALTPDGSFMILCSRSLSMRIFSLTKNDDGSLESKLLRTLKPHPTPVSVLAIDRTGTLLATAGKDGVTKIWDIRQGYQTHSLSGPSVLASSLHFFETPADQRRKRKSVGDEETPENRILVAAGFQNGNVRVFDLHKRTCIAKLDSHVSDVQAIDYSPTQHTVATASRDKTIIWWDTRSWKLRKVRPVFEMVESAGFVGDGRVTYSAGSNGCLRLWETDTGRELTEEQEAKAEENGIVSAIYRKSKDLILCVQLDHTLSFFRTPEIQEHPPLPALPPLEMFRFISGTHDEIIDIAYMMPDKSVMALATNSEDIRIVSVANRQPSLDAETGSRAYFGQDVGLLKGHEEIIISLDVDWSGHWIATGAKDNTAKLWKVDVTTGQFVCYATFTGHAQSVSAVALPKAIPPDSSPAFKKPLDHPPPFLLTGSEDQTVKKWEIPRHATTAAARAILTKKAHDKDINAIDIHHASQLFATASQDKTVKIWSIQEGEGQAILRGHRRGVWTVKFAPRNLPVIQGEEGPAVGRGAVLTGSSDKTVKLWSLSDYSCLRTYEGHSHSVLKVAWLPPPGSEGGSGNRKRPLLFASAGGDGLVKLWNAQTGETEATLDNHEDRVWALAVQERTGEVVSGGADSRVTVWRDTTEETMEKGAVEEMRLVEQEQELQNHMRGGNYRDAIVLALQLNHPGRLLGLLTSVVTTESPDAGSLSGLKDVDTVLATLSDEQIFLLLLRLRDWNTNARTSPVAQKILWTVMKSYPASRLVNLKVREKKSLGAVLRALRVYSERHYKRMEELLDESFMVEYTLQQMGTLLAVGDGEVVSVEGGANGGRDGDGDVIMF